MNRLRAVLVHNAKLLFIAFGAFFALGFAFYAQYVNGYHPCELCMVQRWIYAAVLIAIIPAHAKLTKANKTPVIAGMIITALLLAEVLAATYHFGIEQKWWEGLEACSSGLGSGLSGDELRNKIYSAPVTRCDQATWYFLGLSMAGWNVVYSLILFLVSLIPAKLKVTVDDNDKHYPANQA